MQPRDHRFGDWDESNIIRVSEPSAESIADLLTTGLDCLGIDSFRVESFEEAGTLTSDAGFMLRMDDGSTFQVTVVRGR